MASTRSSSKTFLRHNSWRLIICSVHRVDKEKKAKKRSHDERQDVGADEDVVEDLVLSSDDEVDEGDDQEITENGSLSDDDEDAKARLTKDTPAPAKHKGRKRKSTAKQRNKEKKLTSISPKKNGKRRPRKKAKKSAHD